MPTGNKVTVGVVIPTISSKLVQIQAVKEVKDVLNRVAGMTGLDYGQMVAHCGGKTCPEWHLLAEGDVVYIEYPHEKLPDNLKERAAKEAASGQEKLYIPRPKLALPIKAPTDGLGTYKQNAASEGVLIDLPAPVHPLPFRKGPVIDHLTGEPTPETSLPTVPRGIQQWENNFYDFKPFEAAEPFPAKPLPTAIASRYQPKWTIPVVQSPSPPGSISSSASSLFSKGYQKIKKNPLIRINFEFWTGQELALQLHPENRIGDIVHNLVSMLKDGKVDVTAERLIFVGPDPDKKIGLQDKMIFLFPDRPAAVKVKVFLSDFGGEVVEMNDATIRDSFWKDSVAQIPPVFPQSGESEAQRNSTHFLD